MTFSGLNCVVTGATRGLGFAFAKSLVDAGGAVVLNGRNVRSCSEAAARIDATGKRVRVVAGSVSDEDVADALIDTCANAFGSVDFVVNNAGITRDRSLLKMSTTEFDDVVAVHLRGTWLMCRAAATAMKNAGGSILNVTSGSALYGLVGQSNYAAAKGGIIALTRSLSLELERFSIRVNALYPVARTNMTDPVLGLSGGEDGTLRDVFGDPSAVAALVPWLAADLRVTGQVIAFDGKSLSVWSHPAQAFSVEHAAPWSTEQLASGMTTLNANQEPLNVDDVGRAVRRALRSQ